MCLFKVCFLRSWEILHRISERFAMCVLKMNVHNESLRESSHQRMQLSNCRLSKYFWGVSWWSRSLDFSLPWQEAKVSSLIRELRSSMLRAKSIYLMIYQTMLIMCFMTVNNTLIALIFQLHNRTPPSFATSMSNHP